MARCSRHISCKIWWSAGPTIATVGLSIQVPFAVLAEASFSQPAWLSHHGSTALMVVGAVAVLLGFLGVTLRPAVVPRAHIPAENAEMSSPCSPAVSRTAQVQTLQTVS